MPKPRPRTKPSVETTLPLKRRPTAKADPCAADKAHLRTAAAIVAQVVAHFGAGIAVEREKTSPGSTAQLFAAPSDLASFHDLLITSTLKHLSSLNWDADQPRRDFVCFKAFEHGKLAYREQPAPLTFTVILSTLRDIQKTCPTGAGGGKVCDF